MTGNLKSNGYRILHVLLTLSMVLSIAVIMPILASAADDYPYKNNTPGGKDEWNFFYRECTSFVAWRLNNNNGIRFTNQYGGLSRWGNAYEWKASAQSLGITVDSNPAVGAVAWNGQNQNGAGGYGHIAWVSAVNGNNVTIEEYNWDTHVNSYNTRTVDKSKFAGYIHINDIGAKPGKPTLHVKPDKENGYTVFYWDAAANADHYSLHFYKNGNYYTGTGDIWGTQWSWQFPESGNFTAHLESLNSKQPSQVTYSDTISFYTEATPGKPVLNIQVSETNSAITISWNATSNTNSYDLYVVDSANNKVVTAYGYNDTKYTTQLGAGSYKANVGAIGTGKENWNFSDEVGFTVQAPPIIEDPIDIPEAPPSSNSTAGKLNGIVLTATVTDIGVKFDWTPNNNTYGYRIYRSKISGVEGISITDFPITAKDGPYAGQYVDVNVDPDTQYYYTIRAVVAEASFNMQTVDIIPEQLGPVSEELIVKTSDIITEPPPALITDADSPEPKKNFILMTIGNDTMLVNDEIKEIDPGMGTTPLIKSGRTLTPIRVIIETMGGTAGWVAEEARVKLEVYENILEMQIGNKVLLSNGETKEMDVAPEIINNRTMLPLRFVSENVGCQIAWIGSSQQIVIVFYTFEAEL